MVRRLVTRFFGAGADTPDLSQEVFLRLFRRIDELRNPSALRGFVVSICLGVARNELRRAQVRRWVRLTSTGDLPDAPVARPDLEAREALRRLYAVLDQVSVQDRSLFVARFFEKMEIAEVAVVHGLSYGTAKRHVARASLRINKRIERDPLLARYLDGAAERARHAATGERCPGENVGSMDAWHIWMLDSRGCGCRPGHRSGWTGSGDRNGRQGRQGRYEGEAVSESVTIEDARRAESRARAAAELVVGNELLPGPVPLPDFVFLMGRGKRWKRRCLDPG